MGIKIILHEYHLLKRRPQREKHHKRQQLKEGTVDVWKFLKEECNSLKRSVGLQSDAVIDVKYATH